MSEQEEVEIPIPENGKGITWKDVRLVLESYANLQQLLRIQTQQQADIREEIQGILDNITGVDYDEMHGKILDAVVKLENQEQLEAQDIQQLKDFQRECHDEVKSCLDKIKTDTGKINNILLAIIGTEGVIILGLIGVILKMIN